MINDYQNMLEELYRPFKALHLTEIRHTVHTAVGRPSGFGFNPGYRVGKTERDMADRFTAAASKLCC